MLRTTGRTHTPEIEPSATNDEAPKASALDPELEQLLERDGGGSSRPPKLYLPLSREGDPVATATALQGPTRASTPRADAAEIGPCFAAFVFPLQQLPQPRPPRAVLRPSVGLALALAVNVIAIAAVLLAPPRPSVIVERPAPLPQLSMDRAPSPAQPREARVAAARVPRPPAPQPAASMPEPPQRKPTPAASERPSPRKPKAATATKNTPTKAPSPTARPAAGALPAASLSAECLIDPSRCPAASALASARGSTAAGDTGARASLPDASPPDAPLPEILSTSDMRPIVARHKARAQECASASPREVTVKLSIAGETGRILASDALGPHAGTALGRCVAQAFADAVFPPFTKPQMGLQLRVRVG